MSELSELPCLARNDLVGHGAANPMGRLGSQGELGSWFRDGEAHAGNAAGGAAGS